MSSPPRGRYNKCYALVPMTEANVGNRNTRLVVVTSILLAVTCAIFVVTGYTALYWAWPQRDASAALPFLPWARCFGALAMAFAAAAFGILFSTRVVITPRVRLRLSLLATVTVALFAEFRNEGKFYFGNRHHVFSPGTWVHDSLDAVVPSAGNVLYRIEYSHWNDFLMGPAIVSVLYVLAFARVRRAAGAEGTLRLSASSSELSVAGHDDLRFARLLMNVGLFWFFIQAWAEKAGYFANPFSSDQVDLPVEFAGTMLGFWMARVLTRPFDGRTERFNSTLLVDFVSSGVIGLLYTVIVGPLSDTLSSAVGHGLNRVVPAALDAAREPTVLERHMRPIELLLLAGVTWWGFGQVFRAADRDRDEPRWAAWKTLAVVVAIAGVYVALFIAALSLAEPESRGWALTIIGVGVAAAFAAHVMLRRARRQSVPRLFNGR